MMNTQTITHIDTKTAMAIALLALGLVLVVSLPISMISNQAFADNEHQGGPGGQKNNGQCKQIFNENVCKKKHTGSG
jgi:hypothetical protein